MTFFAGVIGGALIAFIVAIVVVDKWIGRFRW